jgi:uncharacterized protein (DUF885 family)
VKKLALFSLAALLVLPATLFSQLKPSTSGPASPEDRAKALHSLFHDYWEDILKRKPEIASLIGDNRYNDQISDRSVKATNEWLAAEQGYLMKLAAIDPTGLSDQDRTSRELLMRDLTDDQEAAEFKEWEMPVDQMGGIYSDYPQLVAQLSFATAKDYNDWIARLHQIPRAFEQVTENISLGIVEKRVPPKILLEKALEQVKQLADQKPEDSPLAMPLKKFPASIPAAEQTHIKTEMIAAISKEVLPAYQRFARFLEVTYIPAGRTEPGISSIPGGAKYYQFLIKRTTTTSLTADQIHQIGLDEVRRNETDELAIAQKLGFKDLASFRASLKSNPKLHPASGDALLDAYRAFLTPMQAKLPTLFGRLPKAPFEVAPVPDYLEKSSAGAYYELGTPDGSRPGRLRIDTWNALDRNLFEVECTAYHEGIPGHHMQISISQEQTGVTEFRRYEGYTAFVEGWALYSERLGKDLGLYQDPYSDYGRLEGDNLRAIRLVVDTGVHAKHWTRQQMVDFFHDHSSTAETEVQAEVNRYIAWPSQALAYKIGQLKILELRDRAQKDLGDKFDIRAFHDQVIDYGALPLDVLDERITAWIASEKQGVRGQ